MSEIGVPIVGGCCKNARNRKTRVAHVGEGLVPSRRNQFHIAKKCSADSHCVRNRRTFLLVNIFARRAAARAAPTARPSFLQLRCIFATGPRIEMNISHKMLGNSVLLYEIAQQIYKYYKLYRAGGRLRALRVLPPLRQYRTFLQPHFSFTRLRFLSAPYLGRRRGPACRRRRRGSAWC